MFITLLVPFYFLPPKINIRMGEYAHQLHDHAKNIHE